MYLRNQKIDIIVPIYKSPQLITEILRRCEVNNLNPCIHGVPTIEDVGGPMGCAGSLATGHRLLRTLINSFQHNNTQCRRAKYMELIPLREPVTTLIEHE